MFPGLGYTAVVLTNYDGPAMMPVIMKLRELIPTTSSSPSGQSQQQTPVSQSEQEVRKSEREWLDAYEQHEAAAMDRIPADEFKLTRSGGVAQTKADILAALKTGRDSGRAAPKSSPEDVANSKVVLLPSD